MKRFLSMILVVIMVLSAIPAMALFTNAAEMTLENVASGKSFTTGAGATTTIPSDGNYGNYVDISWSLDKGATHNENCWVQVDLGTATVVSAIKVANYPMTSRYYQWEAYGSNDASFTESTLLCEKKDTLASISGGYSYDVTNTTAYRYIRIVGTYNSANEGYHFNEVEVYAATENSVEVGGEVDGGYLNGGDAYWQVMAINVYGDLAVNLFSDKETAPTLTDYTAALQGPWAAYVSKVVEVNIYGVANVPKNAFNNFDSLKTVRIGEGVTTITNDAFAYCTGPISFSLPSTITSIKQGIAWSTTCSTVTTAATEEQYKKITFGAYNDSFKPTAISAYETPVVFPEYCPTVIPSSEIPQLSGAKFNSNMENWSGDTQILYGVAPTEEVTSNMLTALYNNRADYKWTLVVDGIEYKQDPAYMSSFTLGGNVFYRFEPVNGTNPFIPEKGKNYSIDLKIADAEGTDLYYVTSVASGYQLNDYPIIYTSSGYGATFTPFVIGCYGGGMEYWGGQHLYLPSMPKIAWNGAYIDYSKVVAKITDRNVEYTVEGKQFWDSYFTDVNIRIAVLDFGWTPELGRDYTAEPFKFEVIYDGQVIATTNFTGSDSATQTEYGYALDISSEANGTAKVIYDATTGEYTLTVLSVNEGFVFDGWYDGEGTLVSESITYKVTPAVGDDLTFVAKYKVPAQTYTITWVVDGVSTTSVVEEGKVPEYLGGEPTKASTEYTFYYFSGWDVTPVEATADATYTAQFKAVPISETISVGVYGTGMENWSGQTQLLITIPEEWRDVINSETYNDFKWNFEFSWTENGEVKYQTCEGWKPTSNYDNWIVRFETCLYENAFVPKKDVEYNVNITLTIQNPEFDNEETVRYTLDTGTNVWKITVDPIVPVIDGDINGDTEVNIADVSALLDFLASLPEDATVTSENEKYDLDGSNSFTISDVTILLDMLAE